VAATKSGKRVIILLLAVGLAAATFSLWYHYQSGQQALALWGREAAVLIARAPTISAEQLAPADAAASQTPGSNGSAAPLEGPIERLGIGGKFYRVVARSDASQARGVSNIRRALLMDITYRWGETGPEPSWQYALVFQDEAERRSTVLFDFASGQVGSTTASARARLDPAAIDDWRSFFEEQFVAK
jgi:hypothetical protein